MTLVNDFGGTFLSEASTSTVPPKLYRNVTNDTPNQNGHKPSMPEERFEKLAQPYETDEGTA